MFVDKCLGKIKIGTLTVCSVFNKPLENLNMAISSSCEHEVDGHMVH